MTQINEAETAKSAQKRQAAKAAVRARFSQLKARINRRFREHIPNHTLRGLATVALEDNGAISRFGITIAPNQIRQTDAN